MGAIFTVLVFFGVIIVLVLAHEFGHFLVAKWSKMRVDEFGIFFPPRAVRLGKIGETEYTLNWLPLGGFVKIYGEDPTHVEITEGESTDPEASRAFSARPRILQALVLVAGVFMNLLLSYVLITATLVMGTQQALTPQEVATVKDATVAISTIAPNSPAAKAGFMPGDEIISATSTQFFNAAHTAGLQYSLNINQPGGRSPDTYASLIATDASNTPMQFTVLRNGKYVNLQATPQAGFNAADPARPVMGFTLTAVGTVKTPLLQAPLQGLQITWLVLKETLAGLGHLIAGLVTGHANLSQVAGPVGIAKDLGGAASQGLAALLTLTAIISINLAIVNLIPIPALDGGRLLFVIIESITRKPINPKIANWINNLGFILLILLVLVVTWHDIFG